MAIDDDRFRPKEFIEQLFKDATPPDFGVENEPHRILAALPIPIYLTTNFDDFLSQALRRRGDRDAVLRLCPWNKHLLREGDLYEPESPKPSVANPLVSFLGVWISQVARRRGDDILIPHERRPGG